MQNSGLRFCRIRSWLHSPCD